jgi:hypothetical protein
MDYIMKPLASLLVLLALSLASCPLGAQGAADPNEGPAAQAAAPEPDRPSPALYLPETEYEAGDVDPSSTVSHDFVVRNTGTAELIIKNVVPGCGCSVASFTSFIPPGGEGRVTLSVDIYAEWAGHNVFKSAVIMSSDAVNPDARITIRARVREKASGANG